MRESMCEFENSEFFHRSSAFLLHRRFIAVIGSIYPKKKNCHFCAFIDMHSQSTLW